MDEHDDDDDGHNHEESMTTPMIVMTRLESLRQLPVGTANLVGSP